MQMTALLLILILISKLSQTHVLLRVLVLLILILYYTLLDQTGLYDTNIHTTHCTQIQRNRSLQEHAGAWSCGCTQRCVRSIRKEQTVIFMVLTQAASNLSGLFFSPDKGKSLDLWTRDSVVKIPLCGLAVMSTADFTKRRPRLTANDVPLLS